LLQAKASLGHGQWLPWLATTGIPERGAQRYMRIAGNRATIEAKFDSVTDLSVTTALRLLSKPVKPDPVRWSGPLIDVLETMKSELTALTELVGEIWPDAPDDTVLDLRAAYYRAGHWPTAQEVRDLRLSAEAALAMINREEAKAA
jgi:hypothetical protein